MASAEGGDNERVLRNLAAKYWKSLETYPWIASQGINLIYGPSLDVSDDPESYLFRSRRIHASDPSVAALFARLTIAKTLKQHPRSLFVIKHAPGIGKLPRNPEWSHEVELDPRSQEEIAGEFMAFASTVKAQPGHVAVMLSAAAHPAFDPEARPAIFSPPTVSWVRSHLPQETVLIADDLVRDVPARYVMERHQFGNLTAGLRGLSNELRFRLYKETLREALLAGTDLFLLYYKKSEDRELVIRAAAEIVKEGIVSRKDFEDSVRRIFVLKQKAFPKAEKLKQIDQLVRAMSTDQLLLQKLILPAWDLRHSLKHLENQVGGIAFEGVAHASSIRTSLQRRIVESSNLIPSLFADNSPQEVGSRVKSVQAAQVNEIDIMRTFTREVEMRFHQRNDLGGILDRIGDIK